MTNNVQMLPLYKYIGTVHPMSCFLCSCTKH